MAVKKCEDLEVFAVEGTREGENGSGQGKAPKKKKKVLLPSALGKTFQAVENANFSNPADSKPAVLQATKYNKFIFFDPSGVLDRFRGQHGKFWTFNEGLVYVNPTLEALYTPPENAAGNYGSKIGIFSIDLSQPITEIPPSKSSLISTYQQNMVIQIAPEVVDSMVDDNGNQGTYNHVAAVWNTFVNGGTYNDYTAKPLFDVDTQFTDHYFTLNLPFSKNELERYINLLNHPAQVSVEPDYDFYINYYENLIKRKTIKETMLPNMYSQITRTKNYEQNLHDQGVLITPNTYRRDYFNRWAKRVLNNPKQALASGNKYKNIAIGSGEIDVILGYKEQENLYPMNININLQTERTGHMLIACDEAGMTNDVMKFAMNEIMEGVSPAAGPPRYVNLSTNINFAQSKQKIVVTDIEDFTKSKWWMMPSTTIESTSKMQATLEQSDVQVMDLGTWLTINLDAESEGTEYLKKTNFDRDHIFLGISTDKSQQPNECNSFEQALKSIILTGKINSILQDKFRTFEELLAGEEAYNETLIYEIVQYSANDTTTPLQRIFVPNTEKLSLLTYIDTQVKYDKQYTYEIYAHQFIVGTKYQYSDLKMQSQSQSNSSAASMSTQSYVTDPDVFSYDNRVGIKVNFEPSLAIARVQIYKQNVRVLDDAPIAPNVDIVPYKGVNNNILVNLSGNSGRYMLRPIIINARDAKFVRKYKQSRHILPHERIQFSSDDPVGRFEAYRVDEPPKNYKSFAGKILTIVGNNKASSASFVDTMQPNKKYYYTFRGIDIHGNRSNPTPVYQVELVDQNGVIFFNTSIYEFPTESGRKTPTKIGRRYLKINPNLVQSLINYDIFLSNLSSAYDANNVMLGHANKPVWKKRFKIRVTSKHSGKKFDINLTCKVQFDKKDKNKKTASQANSTKGGGMSPWWNTS
tara:strand:- start:4831 stop:7590 length:2760 start_codon:yes stop_codon:yes gene_type:complete